MSKKLKFFEGNYQALAALIFYSTITLILAQKLSFLFDRKFLYEIMSDTPSANASIAQISGYFFGIVRIPEVHTFLLWGEILLLLRMLFFKPDLVSFTTLLAFSTITYRGSYYLQDGGSNLSHIALLYCTFYVLGVSTFAEHERISKLCHRLMISLLRFQLVFLYLVAFISKSQGALWQSGDALYYILQNDYFSNPLAKQLIMHYPVLSKIGIYPVFLFQFSFPLLVWFKPTRKWILLAGVVFHFFIGLVMNIWLFSLSMIVFYAVFLDAKEGRCLMDKISDYAIRLKSTLKDKTHGVIRS